MPPAFIKNIAVKPSSSYFLFTTPYSSVIYDNSLKKFGI